LLLFAVFIFIVVTEIVGLRAKVGLSEGLRGGWLIAICIVKSANAGWKRAAHN
jgi:hypothetical protein